MLKEAFKSVIEKADYEVCKSALMILLDSHASPVFGAAKTIEHEIAALNALKILGYIDYDADEYDLVEKLRITKTKSKSLLYQAALRKQDGDPIEVDISLINALESTQIIKDGKMFIIEIPEPLTMDRMRKKLREAGYLSDGSFSNSIAKISEDALVKIVEELIPENKKIEMNKKLLDSRETDDSIAGIIKAMIEKAAEKYAGETGVSAVRKIGNKIISFLNNPLEETENYINTR